MCLLAACGRIGFDDVGDDDGGFVGTGVTYLKASNTDAGDSFGAAVAISASGDTIAVGAFDEASGDPEDPGDNSAPSAGAVYVFVRTANGWAQQAYIKSPAPDADDLFGTAVALSADGNVLAVGALGEDTDATGVNGPMDELGPDAGAAFVYRRTGGAWGLEAFVKASNTDAGDQFGSSIALSGDGTVLVVGAPNEDADGPNIGQGDNSARDAGAAYVFLLRNGQWGYAVYLKAKNPTPQGDHFGDALAISRDASTIVVGAYLEASSQGGIDPPGTDNASIGAGAAYVFDRTGDFWMRGALIKASNAEAGDQFGAGIAVSGDGQRLVVGGHLEDSDGDPSNNNVNNAGAAYVVERSGGVWQHVAYVKSPVPREDYNYGLRLSMDDSGHQIAIGASNDASAAGGIGANPDDTSAFGAGAVHVVDASGTQRAYLKASAPDAGDTFVTVTQSANGRVLVVGAYHEDSAATGIDGDATDDSAPDSGAVYVYE